MTIRSRFKFIHVVSVILTALALGLALKSARAAPQPIPVLLLDIAPGWDYSRPEFGTELNGVLYFTAYSPEFGTELWRSDGTRAGTYVLKDIYAGTEGSHPSSKYPDTHKPFTRFGNRLYFSAKTPEYGYELWATDGTAAGTVMIADIRPGPEDSAPGNFTVYRNRLYFDAVDMDHGDELWSTDGTAAGTRLVAETIPGPGGPERASYPADFAVFQNRLYFAMRKTDGTQELWKTNGTASGTVLVSDGGETPLWGIGELTPAGSRLYFTAYDDLHGDELWRTNGTAAGTGLVMDINTQPDPLFEGQSEDSYPFGLTGFNGWLYFSAQDGIHGMTIWRTNGTAANTKIFKDFDPAVEQEYARTMGVMGNTLYIAGGTSYENTKLWKTNGNAASTSVVSNRVIGASGLTEIINGSLYFIAYSGEAYAGPQIWSTRGTDATTTLLGYLDFGNLPQDLFSAGGKLFIVGNTVELGDELYTLERTPDLQVRLSNLNGGSVPKDSAWTWRLEVSNGALAQPATFAAGQRILSDTLPRGPVYPAVTSVTPLTGSVTGTINCTISTSVLTCKAGQGGVTLDASSAFEVLVTGITAAPGAYTNPRNSNQRLCSVDPWLVITETVEGNNRCGLDIVTVTP